MKILIRGLVLLVVTVVVVLVSVDFTRPSEVSALPKEYWSEAPPRPDGAACWKLYVRYRGFMGVSCG